MELSCGPCCFSKKSVNSEPIKYVIDPSIKDTTVLLDSWVARMTSKSDSPIIKTSFPIPNNTSLVGRIAVATSSISPYLLTSPNDKC